MLYSYEAQETMLKIQKMPGAVEIRDEELGARKGHLREILLFLLIVEVARGATLNILIEAVCFLNPQR